MSQEDRDKWDRRYAEGSYEARTWPTELLETWLPHLPRGRALDVACGAGRNALFLAANGYRVDAVDVSAVALERAGASARERGLDVRFARCDFDVDPIPGDGYELIVVARFIDRALCPRLVDALGEGGRLVYEHHLLSSRPVGGPRSATFRLAPNELLELFRGLRVLHYQEGVVDERDGHTMALAQLVACKGDAGF